MEFGQINISPTILSGGGTRRTLTSAVSVSLQNGFGALGYTVTVYNPDEGHVTVILFGPTIGNGVINGEIFQVNPLPEGKSVEK